MLSGQAGDTASGLRVFPGYSRPATPHLYSLTPSNRVRVRGSRRERRRAPSRSQAFRSPAQLDPLRRRHYDVAPHHRPGLRPWLQPGHYTAGITDAPWFRHSSAQASSRDFHGKTESSRRIKFRQQQHNIDSSRNSCLTADLTGFRNCRNAALPAHCTPSLRHDNLAAQLVNWQRRQPTALQRC